MCGQKWYVCRGPGFGRGGRGVLYREGNGGSSVLVSVEIGVLGTNRAVAFYRTRGRATLLLVTKSISFIFSRGARGTGEHSPFLSGTATVRFTEGGAMAIGTGRRSEVMVRRASGSGSFNIRCCGNRSVAIRRFNTSR